MGSLEALQCWQSLGNGAEVLLRLVFSLITTIFYAFFVSGYSSLRPPVVAGFFCILNSGHEIGFCHRQFDTYSILLLMCIFLPMMYVYVS